MLLASSVFVVPISKKIGNALICQHTPEGVVLVYAPHIECYVGNHLYLLFALTIITPLYLVLLVPFAVVNGDTTYVQASELFNPTTWMFNAERKATDLYLGPMHVDGRNAFRVRVLDLAAKLMLPLIALFTAEQPKLQTVLLAFVGLTMLISSVIWKQLLNESFNIILRGSRAFTLCAMLSGCLTAFIDDPTRSEPLVFFAVSAVLVIAFTSYIAYKVRIEDDETNAPVIHIRSAKSVSID